MHTLRIGHITTKAPSLWNELTKEQLLSYCYVLTSSIPEERKLRTIAFYLSGFPEKVFNKLNVIQRTELYRAFDFLFEKTNLTKVLINKFRAGARYFYGPSEALSNITINEFRFAEAYFINYCKAQDPVIRDKFLCKLIATLWRPKRFINIPFRKDLRLKFDSDYIDARAKVISKLDSATKLALFTIYKGCRTSIISGKYSKVFESSGKASSGNDGYAMLIINLSGPKFGDVDKTAETPLYTILDYLKYIKENAPDKDK